MSKYPAIRRAIQEGEVDEYLDEIALALYARRAQAGKELAYKLDVGDYIVISSNCKPRMLARQMVIFKGWDASKLKVELLQTYSAKWRKGSIIRIGPSLIGQISKPATD